MVDRVLARCAQEALSDEDAETEALLSLLRRFAVEAAREEARSYCSDLVAQNSVPQRLVA